MEIVKNKPQFVVLPFGDEEAVQDYLDELWAEKSVAEFDKKKTGKKKWPRAAGIENGFGVG